MIKYTLLKEKILNQLSPIQKNDFYLLEGKLIFKNKEKSLMVKEFLEKDYGDIMVLEADNHNHWKSKYETALFFTDLPKGIQALKN